MTALNQKLKNATNRDDPAVNRKNIVIGRKEDAKITLKNDRVITSA